MLRITTHKSKKPKLLIPFTIKKNKKSAKFSLELRNYFMRADMVKKQMSENPELWRQFVLW